MLYVIGKVLTRRVQNWFPFCNGTTQNEVMITLNFVLEVQLPPKSSTRWYPDLGDLGGTLSQPPRVKDVYLTNQKSQNKSLRTKVAWKGQLYNIFETETSSSTAGFQIRTQNLQRLGFGRLSDKLKQKE